MKAGLHDQDKHKKGLTGATVSINMTYDQPQAISPILPRFTHPNQPPRFLSTIQQHQGCFILIQAPISHLVPHTGPHRERQPQPLLPMKAQSQIFSIWQPEWIQDPLDHLTTSPDHIPTAQLTITRARYFSGLGATARTTSSFTYQKSYFFQRYPTSLRPVFDYFSS